MVRTAGPAEYQARPRTSSLRSGVARSATILLGMALAASLTSCGDEYEQMAHDGVLASEEPVTDPYPGPLHIDPDETDQPQLVERTGAAGLAVDCSTHISGGYQPGIYQEGATADDIAGAFDTAMSEGIYDGAFRDYRIERDAGDRILFTYRVDGSIKQAIIMLDGPATAGAGGPGWHVESWARCDLSEFPDWVAEDNWGAQIWSDAEGNRLPIATIVSYPGPEHCSWEASTFLYLDDGPQAYVRKPPAGLQEDYFREPFRADVQLPADAVDTGYQHADDHLWLSRDGMRAYVGTPEDVELWPRTKQSLTCA